jgi:serine/threonine protein kinase
MLWLVFKIEERCWIFQVLELLDGGSLFGLLHDDERQLTERRQIKLWLDTCLGVRYLHANNVIHRDLKVCLQVIDIFIENFVSSPSLFFIF